VPGPSDRPELPAHLRPGAPARVGSHEHYGWPEATYTVRGLHPGLRTSHEFLQVMASGSSQSLFLRNRSNQLDWTAISPGEVGVAAWHGMPLADGTPFSPARANPESWLYVRLRAPS
jgi:hypothetical protein